MDSMVLMIIEKGKEIREQREKWEYEIDQIMIAYDRVVLSPLAEPIKRDLFLMEVDSFEAAEILMKIF